MEMRSLKKVLTFVLFLFLVGSCYLLFGNYREGSKAGVIKFSKKGILLKTYEGELNLGMSSNIENRAQSSISNTWKFSVHGANEGVVAVLQDALLSGKKVKVKYHEKFIHVFWRGDTKNFVFEAEVIE